MLGMNRCDGRVDFGAYNRFMNDPIAEDNGSGFDLLGEWTGSEPSLAQEPANEDAKSRVSYRPELPDWGVYLTWPTEGQSWIHAADLGLALSVLPSRRVFHRTRWDRTFYQLHYGELSIRVRPTMWVRVESVDLQVGQQVELLSRDRTNDPGIFKIRDILFCPRKGVVEFALSQRGMTLPRMYSRDDLRPLNVVHNLRVGYFQHLPQKSRLPSDIELLDVGNLTAE